MYIYIYRLIWTSYLPDLTPCYITPQVKKFAAPEGQVLPVLSLCLSSRLEKVLGAASALDLNSAMLGSTRQGFG